LPVNKKICRYFIYNPNSSKTPTLAGHELTDAMTDPKDGSIAFFNKSKNKWDAMDLNSISGTKGEKGDPGETGPKGEKGDQGEAGLTGGGALIDDHKVSTNTVYSSNQTLLITGDVDKKLSDTINQYNNDLNNKITESNNSIDQNSTSIDTLLPLLQRLYSVTWSGKVNLTNSSPLYLISGTSYTTSSILNLSNFWSPTSSIILKKVDVTIEPSSSIPIQIKLFKKVGGSLEHGIITLENIYTNREQVIDDTNTTDDIRAVTVTDKLGVQMNYGEGTQTDIYVYFRVFFNIV